MSIPSNTFPFFAADNTKTTPHLRYNCDMSQHDQQRVDLKISYRHIVTRNSVEADGRTAVQ